MFSETSFARNSWTSPLPCVTVAPPWFSHAQPDWSRAVLRGPTVACKFVMFVSSTVREASRDVMLASSVVRDDVRDVISVLALETSATQVPVLTWSVTPARTTGIASVSSRVPPLGSADTLMLDMFDIQEVPGLSHEEVPTLGEQMEGFGGRGCRSRTR